MFTDSNKTIDNINKINNEANDIFRMNNNTIAQSMVSVESKVNSVFFKYLESNKLGDAIFVFPTE